MGTPEEEIRLVRELRSHIENTRLRLAPTNKIRIFAIVIT